MSFRALALLFILSAAAGCASAKKIPSDKVQEDGTTSGTTLPAPDDTIEDEEARRKKQGFTDGDVNTTGKPDVAPSEQQVWDDGM
ncbi:MAG TPA: hypothetical protein VM432_00525 [Bdellovibrionales bacterium]|jgi:hypothetical protein|nr:hypothetical protein [Bdellovibrionales bacterium]